jgi:hypothetical protein
MKLIKKIGTKTITVTYNAKFPERNPLDEYLP